MPNFKNELWSKFEHRIQLSDFFDRRDPENEEIFADAEKIHTMLALGTGREAALRLKKSSKA